MGLRDIVTIEESVWFQQRTLFVQGYFKYPPKAVSSLKGEVLNFFFLLHAHFFLNLEQYTFQRSKTIWGERVDKRVLPLII